MADWKFITNHAQVLLCIARDQETRLREVAEACGITERAAHRIVADLEEAGYTSRERIGRRNRYEFHPEVAMRHPRMEQRFVHDIRMGDLIAPLMARTGPACEPPPTGIGRAGAPSKEATLRAPPRLRGAGLSRCRTTGAESASSARSRSPVSR